VIALWYSKQKGDIQNIPANAIADETELKEYSGCPLFVLCNPAGLFLEALFSMLKA